MGPLLVLALLAAPSIAAADDMDLSLARLRINTASPNLPADCLAIDPQSGSPRAFCPDNEAWSRLMSEFGGSMIPLPNSEARTVGYGGFYFGIDSSITGIDANSAHFRLGTEGDERAGTEECSDIGTGIGCNRFASSTLFWTRLGIRKGFPFGFELGTSFGYLLDTQLWSWGLEIKWALFEGFRTGIGILPDLAVRGMVNTMVGDGEFNLTVPSIDVIISKRLVIASTMLVTPFVSGQMAWIFADSELVDLTPDVDASENGVDLTNNAAFSQIRATRYRLNIGVTGQYEALTLRGAFGFDLLKPGVADDDIPEDQGRQWTATFGAGLTF